jgi:3-oxoacyl-[acyl-carrier-protein] synthase-1
MGARAEILGVGMVTPIGFCALQTAAAVRAGIARMGDSYLYDQFGEPIVMGLIDDTELPPLVDALEGADLPVQRRRRLRMAGPALGEALAAVPEAAPLILGGPEPRRDSAQATAGAAAMIDDGFLDQVALQSGRPLDRVRSGVVARGRAAGLVALDRAVALVERGEAPYAVAGGVDSYLDADLLRALDTQRRLRNGDVQDGFIPGEAAVFVLVGRAGSAARLGREPLASVLGFGFGREDGHIYSRAPYRGEGLAAAFRALFQACARHDPIRTLYAGLNGESFWAKELGVARLRNSDRFGEPVTVQHPADALGDPGAALGPLMVGLAALGLAGGYRAGPCLIYCGSDREDRAAVLLAAGTAARRDHFSTIAPVCGASVTDVASA